jgi:SAM-dependent methyltransferase
LGEASKIRDRLLKEGTFEKLIYGRVLDIGCGNDKITESAEAFDLPQGDAQLLESIPDETYDVVFSSHALEHMRSPVEAIHNWWRAVKPGGLLFINCPCEDLYEQGYWPSQNNTDHKVTLTLHKSESWSPVTYNLVDLVCSLPKHKLLAARVIDTNYDYDKLGSGVDQTTHGAEAAIEVVVQKIAQELDFKTNLRNIMICPKCERMELLAQGTLPEDVHKLQVRCHNCGTAGTVTLQ